MKQFTASQNFVLRFRRPNLLLGVLLTIPLFLFLWALKFILAGLVALPLSLGTNAAHASPTNFTHLTLPQTSPNSSITSTLLDSYQAAALAETSASLDIRGVYGLVFTRNPNLYTVEVVNTGDETLQQPSVIIRGPQARDGEDYSELLFFNEADGCAPADKISIDDGSSFHLHCSPGTLRPGETWTTDFKIRFNKPGKYEHSIALNLGNDSLGRVYEMTKVEHPFPFDLSSY